jgi:hypothetical protein|tara:strand:- start:318 stop:608 length:291 start_codon:yes stop_codon:yes gene_type:complete
MVDTTPRMSEFTNGNKRWKLCGELHRTDGPAVEWVDGSKQWYLNGYHHRIDGPATEWGDGGKSWYLRNICYTFDEWLIANAEISEEEKVMLKLKYG